MKVHWFNEINQLRGLAILAVVVAHLSGIFTDMNLSCISVLYMAIDCFGGWAVTCFILISGFVLFNKYKTPFDKNSAYEFYKKHVPFILIPYFIFSAIYILVIPMIIPGVEPHTLQSIVYAFMTGNAFAHLWFFILIAELYLLYPLIVNFYVKYFDNKINLFIVIFVSYFLSVIFMMEKGQSTSIFFDAISCIGYLLYFIMGMEINKQYDHFQSNKLLHSSTFLIELSLLILVLLIPYIFYWISIYFPTSAIPLLSEISYFTNPILFSVITILLLVLLKSTSVKKHVLGILDIFGIYAFGIYLVHPLIIAIITSVVQKNNLVYFAGQIWYLPVMMIICVSLALGVCKIVEKIPYGYNIIGLKHRKI